MDRTRSLRRIVPVLGGVGLLLAAWAQSVSAQTYYYACPPGYYAVPNACVPGGYAYEPPYYYGPSYYGFVPFGFVGGFDHDFDHFHHRGFDHRGFGHGGFGHGGGHH